MCDPSDAREREAEAKIAVEVRVQANLAGDAFPAGRDVDINITVAVT